MGFDIDRFEGEVAEDFVCMICCDVLEDPVEVIPCEHNFCSSCIHDWIKRQPICPTDRAPLQPNNLKPSSRLLRNLLSRLKIKCNNANRGCPAVVCLESLQSHLQQCEFSSEKLVLCSKDRSNPELKKDRPSGEDSASLNLAPILVPPAAVVAGTDRIPRWMINFQICRVSNLSGIIFNPRTALQNVYRRALNDLRCPSSTAEKLVKNSIKSCWPEDLSVGSIYFCQRVLPRYVLRRVRGHQAVVVMSCDNREFRGERKVLEPGFMVIFSHGVE